MNDLKNSVLLTAALLSASPGTAYAVACADTGTVLTAHASTTSTITGEITAMSTAITAAIAAQTGELERVMYDVSSSMVGAINGVGNLLKGAIEAQTAEQQRFLQDQTTSLTGAMSNSADLQYGDPQQGAGGDQVQMTPHAINACEMAIAAGAEKQGRERREEISTGNREQSRRHVSGERFSSQTAYANWFGTREEEVFETEDIFTSEGTMSDEEVALSTEQIGLMLTPDGPKRPLPEGVNTSYPDTEETKTYNNYKRLREEALYLSAEGLSKLVETKAPSVKIDTETQDKHPHWDWENAVSDSDDEMISWLEALRWRATYDYANPDFERELLSENRKALLARLNRQMLHNNVIQMERLRMARLSHAAEMRRFAAETREEMDGQLARYRDAAVSQVARDSGSP